MWVTSFLWYFGDAVAHLYTRRSLCWLIYVALNWLHEENQDVAKPWVSDKTLWFTKAIVRFYAKFNWFLLFLLTPKDDQVVNRYDWYRIILLKRQRLQDTIPMLDDLSCRWVERPLILPVLQAGHLYVKWQQRELCASWSYAECDAQWHYLKCLVPPAPMFDQKAFKRQRMCMHWGAEVDSLDALPTIECELEDCPCRHCWFGCARLFASVHM